MKRFILFGLLAVFIFCTVSCVCAEPQKIEYKFKAGEIDKYKMTMIMSMNIPGMPAGGPMPGNMKMSMVWHQKTLGILPDGSAKILMTYKEMEMSVPGDASKTQKMNQMNGQSVTMLMNKEGQVLGIEGIPQIPGVDMNALLSQTNTYGIFPTEPVDVGQSWSQNMPIPMMGGQMGITSTLLSLNEPVWSIKSAKIKQVYQADMDIAELMRNIAGMIGGNSPEAQQALSEVKGNASLSGWGVSFFSPQLGKLLKMNANMVMALQMTMPAAAVSQGAPSSINLDMNMVVNMTRFK